MDQKISGLYKEVFSTSTERNAKGTELELRVDVDGERPMNVISGDLYSNSGGIRKYLSSFRFQGVRKIETVSNEIVVKGDVGEFDSDLAHFGNILVSIPLDSCPLKAAVQWVNNSGSESKCLCQHASDYFRTVQLEHDYEENVMPLESYETTDLFSQCLQRSHPVSIRDAFAEAGIEIIVVKEKKDSVPHPKGISGESSIWTNSELHEAMLQHFSLLEDTSQWKVWLLSASEYVMSNIKGIMITHKGKKRRGCAVFQNATGWQSPQEKRMRFFIYIHELGHCFNLRHPWDRRRDGSFAKPYSYSTLSWMNYPWMYYSSDKSYGEEAFWEAFHFQFSDSELIHLRHGFRNDVIFGGNTFTEEKDSRSLCC
jgi:hypothetical protein